MACTKTLWLLLLAVPMLTTTVLFSLGYLRNPGLGLRIAWPVRPRTVELKRINENTNNTTYWSRSGEKTS